jgi:prepilin-type N-terminal cleavage/methylation domain-containing protein
MANPQAPARRAPASAGFTLIELMVTIVVAALVASSTFVFFAGQQRIYDTQTKLLNVQQNLWASLEVLSRNIRAAGGGMTSCYASTSPAPAGSVRPVLGLRSYYNGVGQQSLPPYWIKNGASGAPDEIQVNYFINGSAAYTDSGLALTLPLNWVPSTIKVADSRPFRNGEFVTLVDTQQAPLNGDRGCTLFQITAAPGTTNSLTVASTSPWNPGAAVAGFVPFAYTGGVGGTYGVRNLGTLVSLRFYIDSTNAPAVAPRLMMDDLTDASPAQVVAYGIEDMQIAFACDVSPTDGTLTEGTDAATRMADEWIYNQTGDVVPANCGRPSAVRVTLLARTITNDDTLLATSGSTTSSLKPAVEDGAVGAPDTFRHRVLKTTISPRN